MTADSLQGMRCTPSQDATGALTENDRENECYSRIMTREELLSRISIDPNVCFGKPCIRGHRIWVSLVLDFLASGTPTADVLAMYPGVHEADVRACIAYGAEMSREHYVDIPLERSA